MPHSDRATYLENRRRRTHHAIKAKRVLGEWVPQSGPIDEADRILTKMRHNLINYRAGQDVKPSPAEKLIASLRTSQDLHRALKVFCLPSISQRRQMMTARRIAHRLGLIPEREDDREKHLWSKATLKKWRWFTTNTLEIGSGLTLRAGSEVYYRGDGCFDIEDNLYDFYLNAEDARRAGVTRKPRFTGDGRKIRYHNDLSVGG